MIEWDERGSGRPVVLVHGLTEDRHGWDRVVELLAPSRRCIRLDLRGHGASSDADDYSALAMAEDVATVVGEAGVDEPPLVVGHSLGGVVVTAYAATAPVRGVVNVDQSLNLAAFAAAVQQLGPMLRNSAEFSDALATAFAGLGVDSLPSPEREWAHGKHAAARQDVVLGVWGLLLDSDAAALAGTVDQLLEAVRVPYLAVHGSDPGPGYDEWLAERVPGATVEVWYGDGHYPHLVEPQRFVERILAFDE